MPWPAIACLKARGLLLSALEAPAEQPCVVIHRGRVLEVSAPVLAMGVRPGMRAEGLAAIGPEMRRLEYDEPTVTAKRKAWLSLCPPVALAVEPVEGERVLLDLRGEARPEAALRELLRQMEGLGLAGKAGIAPGRLAAQVALEAALAGSQPVAHLTAPLQAAISGVALTHLPAELASLGERALRLGLATFGDLARLSKRRMQALLGKAGLPVWYLAQGLDSHQVNPLYPPPVLTFEGDLPLDLTGEGLAALWERVAGAAACALAHRDTVATEIRLTLRWRMQTEQSRCVLRSPAADAETLSLALTRLWEKLLKPSGREDLRWQAAVRWRLHPAPRQLALGEGNAWESDPPARLQDALRQLRARYGVPVLTPLAGLAAGFEDTMRGYYEAQDLSGYPGCDLAGGGPGNGDAGGAAAGRARTARSVAGDGPVVGRGRDEDVLPGLDL